MLLVCRRIRFGLASPIQYVCVLASVLAGCSVTADLDRYELDTVSPQPPTDLLGHDSGVRDGFTQGAADGSETSFDAGEEQDGPDCPGNPRLGELIDFYPDCDGDGVFDSSPTAACDPEDANSRFACKDGQEPDGGWSGLTGTDCNDEDAAELSCGANATCDDSSGTPRCVCNWGTAGPNGSGCANARSCSELLAMDASLPSGVYTLVASTGEAYEAYCEMEGDGGGWTLVLKVDGRGSDFRYDDARWTSNELLNEHAPDFDFTTAKLRSFLDVPFTRLRLAMNDSFIGNPPIDGTLSADYDPVGWDAITIELVSRPETPAARTAQEFFSVSPQLTSAGRDAWRRLMDNDSMQPGCNEEGHLAPPGTANFTSVRFGIRANAGSGCWDTDSVIGIGIILERLDGKTAGNGLPIPSAGNHCAVDEDSCDQGNIAVPAMAALFVR